MEQLFSLGAFELLKRSFVLISNQADILSANYPVRTERGKKDLWLKEMLGLIGSSQCD